MGAHKIPDDQIVSLNSLGYSLSTIGKKLNCHPTTVTLRLKALNIEPADTRRTFMEDVLGPLTEAQIKALLDRLGPTHSIKDHVQNLLIKDLI